MAPERRGGVAERPNPGRAAARVMMQAWSRLIVPSASVAGPGTRRLRSSTLLVEQAVRRPRCADGTADRLRVLDPACGDGRFLAAAACRRSGRPVDVELVGIEVDAATAAAARRAVPEARILVGDGRTLDPGGPFDVVVGNPPYLGQLARATSRGGRSALGGGPYADAAAEFLARSLALARPDGGRVALVLPQSVLSSRDTGPIRAAVRSRAAVDRLLVVAGARCSTPR